MDGAIKIGMGLATSFAWAIVTCELLFRSGLIYAAVVVEPLDLGRLSISSEARTY